MAEKLVDLDRNELFQEWCNLTLLIDGENAKGYRAFPAPSFSLYVTMREDGTWYEYAGQKWPGDERMRGVAYGVR